MRSACTLVDSSCVIESLLIESATGLRSGHPFDELETILACRSDLISAPLAPSQLTKATVVRDSKDISSLMDRAALKECFG